MIGGLTITLHGFFIMETKLTDTSTTWKKNGEEKYPNDLGVNLSETHQVFVWLWDKTATTHMVKVLSNFDFKYYKFYDNQKSLHQPKIFHNHSCSLFPGHEEYKLLVSARNPYTRYLSSFRYETKEQIELNHKTFQHFLESVVHKENNFDCCSFHERNPNYFVRVEKMYEDYQKIPFIENSDLNRFGKLKELCEKKINFNPPLQDWRDFYTPQLADLVYYSCQNYFDFFGYDKNSWKK